MMVALLRILFGVLTLTKWKTPPVMAIQQHKAKEYCLDQGFKAECEEPNEVVVIDIAHYGIMRIGGCVENNYGYTGCGANVTEALGGLCSARKSCSIANFESTFSNITTNCPKDFRKHLEVAYHCLKVAPPDISSCSSYGYTHLSVSVGHISNAVSLLANDIHCIWVIEVSKGQRINVSLIDYGPWNFQSRHCIEYVKIKEEKGMKNVVSCYKQPGRTDIYTSQSNRIEIQITPANHLTFTGPYFIIAYRAVGCAYPSTLPSDSHVVTMSDDQISIQCNHTNEFWVLQCVENNWKGRFGNCSSMQGLQAVDNRGLFPFGLSLLIIIVVAVCICTITLSIGLIYLHGRRKAKFLKRQELLTEKAYDLAYESSRRKANTLPLISHHHHLEQVPLQPHSTGDDTFLHPDLQTATVLQNRQPVSRDYPVSHAGGRMISLPGTPFSEPRCTCTLRPYRATPEPPRPSPRQEARTLPRPPMTFLTFKPSSDNAYDSPSSSRADYRSTSIPQCLSDDIKSTNKKNSASRTLEGKITV